MSIVQRCAECGTGLGPGAARCPGCSAPVTREIPAGWLMGLALTALAVLSLLALAAGGPGDAPRPAADRTGAAAPAAVPGPPELETLHAHKTINVRRGPGTDHKVVGQVHRGDSLSLAAGAAAWRRIAEGRFEGRYIYSPLLEEKPAPRFEIVTWDWEPRPDFAGGEGTVVWTATVRNNTDRPVPRLRLDFTAQSADGEAVTRDHFYAHDLPPRGEASVKAYADYDGREHSAVLKITR